MIMLQSPLLSNVLNTVFEVGNKENKENTRNKKRLKEVKALLNLSKKRIGELRKARERLGFRNV